MTATALQNLTERHANNLKKRKRLRRLINTSSSKKQTIPAPTDPTPNSWKRLLLVILLLTISISILFAPHPQNNGKNRSFVEKFIYNYHQQYQKIIYGKACSPDLDTTALFASIRAQQILHQELAMAKLEQALRNETRLNAIALIGPPGVGKSMWTQALAESFPWRQNVHSYAWNTYVRDEVEKFRLLRLFVQNLSECGRNLLIIDKLAPCDHEVVSILNKIITEGEGDTNGATDKHVILIYVFSLNTMEHEAVYRQHSEMLKTLPDTRVVNFKEFGPEELKDCIHLEAAMKDLVLSEEDFNEIVATINPVRSGCKNVLAKVLSYGKNQVDVHQRLE